MSETLQMVQAHWQIALLLKTSGILIAVWFLTQRKDKASASQRHLLWSLGLGAALLLTLWQILGPKLPLEVLPQIVHSQKESSGQVLTAEEVEMVTRAANHTLQSSSPLPQSVTVLKPKQKAKPSLSNMLIAAYFLVALGFLFHFAIGLLGVIFLTRKALPLNDENSLAMVAEIAQQLGIKKSPRCLISTRVTMPFTWGFLRPKILLPNEFSGWPAATQRNVLTHEMAHIRRHDWLTGIIARLSTIVHWFNPLSWKALSRLRLEAEHAADDLVLNLGNPATEYADQLLGFVKCANRHPYLRVAMTTMASRSDFSERMHSILDDQKQRHTFKGTYFLGAVLLALTLTGMMGGIELRTRTNESGQIEGSPGSVISEKDRAKTGLLALALGNLKQSVSEAFTDLNLGVTQEDRDFINAVRSGNIKKIVQLMDDGADVNQPIFGDGSPLIQAAAGRDLEIAKLLLEAGADVNLGVRGDGSPLQIAARKRHLEMAKLFIDYGADVNLGVRGDGNPLIAAAKNGDIAMAELLLEHGADIDGFVPGDETPLIQALMARRYKMATFLIEQGADVNKAVPGNSQDDMRSPMRAAKGHAPQAIIDLLLEHGAKEQE